MTRARGRSRPGPELAPVGSASGGKPSPRLGPFDLRRLLLGDWNDVVRDPIDLLRGTLLLGAIGMAAAGDYLAALRLVGAFAVVLLARALDPPRATDLVFTIGMGLQAWGNALGLFEAWPWYNKVVHFVLPFGSAPLLYVLLARLDAVCSMEEPCVPRQSAGIVLVTLALGFTAGGLYEVWEWFIHHALDAPIYVSYDDTVTDMVDNALGSLAGGLVLLLWARRGWGTRRRAGVSPAT